MVDLSRTPKRGEPFDESHLLDFVPRHSRQRDFRHEAFFRYRSLVPAMYLLLLFDTLLRMLVGRLKPVVFGRGPAGVVANYIVLPVSLLILVFCLWT